jgi:hypothetical protein
MDNVLKAFEEKLEIHSDHTWKRIGRCVYCDDCNERLYQGRIPDDHKKVKVKSRNRTPTATQEMRDRWRMDG